MSGFQNVRVVLFDAVGTLIVPQPAVAQAYGQWGRRFGSHLTDEQVGARFRAALSRQEAIDAADPHSRTSEQRELDRWRAIVAEVFDDVEQPAELFLALWSHFAQPQNWAVAPDAMNAWDALSAAGVRIGIASNFDSRLKQVCRGLAPLDRCDLFFISSQLGVRKPNARFFLAIERRLELTGQQLLLVGDSAIQDFRGAQAAGWHALLLDRGLSHSHGESLRSLQELPKRIGIFGLTSKPWPNEPRKKLPS